MPRIKLYEDEYSGRNKNGTQTQSRPGNSSENREGSYSELLKKLRSIEESLNNLKISNNKDDSHGGDFTQLRKEVKNQISELWLGKKGENGLKSILENIGKELGAVSSNFQTINSTKESIRSAIEDIYLRLNKNFPDEGASVYEGTLGELSQNVNNIKNATDIISKKLNAVGNKKSPSVDNAAIESLQGKVETIGIAITEINSKLDGIGNKKGSSVDNAAINSLQGKVEAVSSAVQKLNDDVAHKERKFLSKEMIMIMISVLILTVSTVFISYGVLLRYENGLAFDLTWWALIVYGVTFLATLLIIIFHNRLTKGVVASRIVRIFMALFLVATLALSALSLLSVFLL